MHLIAGSDVAGLTTTAERKGDKYIVNGAKKWITNGVFADYCTAAVRTGEDGKSGVSALIIPLKAPGVSCRKMYNSGVSASGEYAQMQSDPVASDNVMELGSTYIEFDDVEVPVENRLGEENRGFEIIMSSKQHHQEDQQTKGEADACVPSRFQP